MIGLVPRHARLERAERARLSFKRLLLRLVFDFETHVVIIQNSVFTISGEER